MYDQHDHPPTMMCPTAYDQDLQQAAEIWVVFGASPPSSPSSGDRVPGMQIEVGPSVRRDVIGVLTRGFSRRGKVNHPGKRSPIKGHQRTS